MNCCTTRDSRKIKIQTCGRLYGINFENNMEKAACKRWFQSQMTLYGKNTHMTSGQGAPYLTDRQNWLKKNFGCLHTHIHHHYLSKSSFTPTREATVSRLPNAGLSTEESDQPSVREPSTMESISVVSTHGSTEEPLASGTPSQNPRHPTLCNPKKCESELQMAAQERTKKLGALEDNKK